MTSRTSGGLHLKLGNESLTAAKYLEEMGALLVPAASCHPATETPDKGGFWGDAWPLDILERRAKIKNRP